MVTISQIGEHCGEQRRPMDRSQRAQAGGSAVSRAAGAPRVAMVPRVKTLAMQLFAMAAGPKRVLMALSLQAYQLPAGAQRTAALAAMPSQSQLEDLRQHLREGSEINTTPINTVGDMQTWARAHSLDVYGGAFPDDQVEVVSLPYDMADPNVATAADAGTVAWTARHYISKVIIAVRRGLKVVIKGDGKHSIDIGGWKLITLCLHVQWRGSARSAARAEVNDTVFPLVWLFGKEECMENFVYGLTGLKTLVELLAREEGSGIDDAGSYVFEVLGGVSDHIYSFANALVAVFPNATWGHCSPHAVRAIGRGAAEHGGDQKLKGGLFYQAGHSNKGKGNNHVARMASLIHYCSSHVMATGMLEAECLFWEGLGETDFTTYMRKQYGSARGICFYYNALQIVGVWPNNNAIESYQKNGLDASIQQQTYQAMGRVVNTLSGQIVQAQVKGWERPVLSLAVDFDGAKPEVCPLAVEYFMRDDDGSFVIPLRLQEGNALCTLEMDWGENFIACLRPDLVQVPSFAKAKYKPVLTEQFEQPGATVILNRFPLLEPDDNEIEQLQDIVEEGAYASTKFEPVDTQRIKHFVDGLHGKISSDDTEADDFIRNMRYYYHSLVCVVAVSDEFREEHRLYRNLFCVGCKTFFKLGNCCHCEAVACMRGENDGLAQHAMDLPIAKNSKAAKSKATRWKYMDKTMAEKNRAPQGVVLAKAMTRSRRLRGEASSMEEDIN